MAAGNCSDTLLFPEIFCDDSNLCRKCGRRPQGKWDRRCNKCKQKENGIWRKLRQGERNKAGVCIECPNPSLPERLRCSTCNAKRNRKHRQLNLAAKTRCFQAYGGKCACCGESNPIFLSIDHINNDGADHRREIGGGGPIIYRWLKKHNWPLGFQVLCYNCQWGKRICGTCPHQSQGNSK